MARRSRRTHGPAFKAKVESAAINGEKTLAELAQQYDVHANQITAWKAKPLRCAMTLDESICESTSTGSGAASLSAFPGQQHCGAPIARPPAAVDRVVGFR